MQHYKLLQTYPASDIDKLFIIVQPLNVIRQAIRQASRRLNHCLNIISQPDLQSKPCITGKSTTKGKPYISTVRESSKARS